MGTSALFIIEHLRKRFDDDAHKNMIENSPRKTCIHMHLNLDMFIRIIIDWLEAVKNRVTTILY